MNVGLIVVIILGIFFSIFYWYRARLFLKKQLERSLKMVPIEITVAPSTREEKEKLVESYKNVIAKAENVFAAISGIYERRLSHVLIGLKHIALEIVADGRDIKINLAVPISILDGVQKAILGVYPDAEIKEVPEHNIFAKGVKPNQLAGGVLRQKKNKIIPFKTYMNLESDVLQSLTTALTKLEEGEGAGIQILIRPAKLGWTAKSNRFIKRIRAGKKPALNPGDFLNSIFSFFGDLTKSAAKKPGEPSKSYEVTPVDEALIKGLSEKASKPAFDAAIRIIASAKTSFRSKQVVEQIKGAFNIVTDPQLNGFFFRHERSMKKLATEFIFRFFPRRKFLLLNTEELATIFHLQQAVATPYMEKAASRTAPAPAELPASGLLLGKNVYRGETREVRLTDEDKRRHVYMLGQTGTGKSTMLTNMILQDIRDGKGVGVVDPHGDLIDAVLGQIPKERVDDVIIFDPGDLERPMGLNLFEFRQEEQKDFLIQETINMLYALYDPGHTGIVGPRMEHWFRNGALTLMADPEGASFIEVPKIFTDNQYLRQKLKYVNNSVVLDFWTQEMAQTSDFHKSEILGWFNSKFGAFASNTMMRNIIGQHKSGFDLRWIMDNKKILLVNLSKGKTGELNSRILGMIFIMKAQAAAMSRVDQLEKDRVDFTLYVDEFQNFTTESIATILSEARKYRLSLVMANQFIGQLTDNIKNAVFGNVGTVISLRVGVDDAEYMSRQFTPIFNEQDLIQIQNFEAACKIMINGIPSRPFTLSVVKAWEQPGYVPPDKTVVNAIKELSRQKYGRPAEIVSKEIDGYLGTGND